MIGEEVAAKLEVEPILYHSADVCQDISSQEELSICFRWIVYGQPDEHYLTTLHVRKAYAETIAAALTSYMSDHNLDFRKLVGQVMMEQQRFLEKGLVFKRACCTCSLHPLFLS